MCDGGSISGVQLLPTFFSVIWCSVQTTDIKIGETVRPPMFESEIAHNLSAYLLSYKMAMHVTVTVHLVMSPDSPTTP